MYLDAFLRLRMINWIRLKNKTSITTAREIYETESSAIYKYVCICQRILERRMHVRDFVEI